MLGALGADGDEGALAAEGADGALGAEGALAAEGADGALGAEGALAADGDEGALAAEGADGALGAEGALAADGAEGALGEEATATEPVPNVIVPVNAVDPNNWVMNERLFMMISLCCYQSRSYRSQKIFQELNMFLMFPKENWLAVFLTCCMY